MKDDEGFADDITTPRSFKRRRMEIHEANEVVKLHLIPWECPREGVRDAVMFSGKSFDLNQLWSSILKSLNSWEIKQRK